MENQQGFSLLEVVISLLFVSIGSVVLLQQQANLTIFYADLQIRNQTLQIAENACQVLQYGGKLPLHFDTVQIQQHVNTLILEHRGRNDSTYTLSYPCAES